MLSKFFRVLFGFVVMILTLFVFCLVVGALPTALPFNARSLLFELFVIIAFLIITNGSDLFFKSIQFLFSERFTFDESDFKSAAALLKSLAKTVLLTGAVLALIRVCVIAQQSDIDFIKHGIAAAASELATGALLVLFIFTPIQASLAAKFHKNQKVYHAEKQQVTFRNDYD